MTVLKPAVLIIAAGLLSGCDDKAPELPPPEPTAVILAAPASSLPLQQTTTVDPAA